MRKQNAKAHNGMKCLYLDKATGFRCAAGCCIPLKQYAIDMEFDGSIGNNPIVEDVLQNAGHDLKLMRALQVVHDFSEVNRWEQGFETVAKDFGLKYKPTNQATFDKVVNHLRRQGCKSEGSYTNPMTGQVTSGCVYRGPNNLMCAAGCLIPNEDYTPKMEGQPANVREVKEVLEKNGHNVELAQKFQNIHDRRQVQEWETQIEQLAQEFNLIYTPVDMY